MSLNDINSLSHTKWNCKYHIVFAPKYRRKVFYKEKRVEEKQKYAQTMCICWSRYRRSCRCRASWDI